MNCVEFTTAIVCFTPFEGDPRNLVAHYAYGPDGAGNMRLTSTRYTEADGITVVDTSTGAVSAGACPVSVEALSSYPLVARRVPADSDAFEITGRMQAVSVTTFDHPAVVTVGALPAFTLPAHSTWSVGADAGLLLMTVHVVQVSGGVPDYLVTTLWASDEAPMA